MQIPAQSCDCHVHVFDPERFPYSASRSYTPGAASTAQLQDMHEQLGISRVVLVQPSVYGTDNRAMLEAIQTIGFSKARGVAVVDLETIIDNELEQLHTSGIRGIRLNLHTNKDTYGNDLKEAQRQLGLAKRLQNLPRWHVQVYAGITTHAALLSDYATLGMPVVLDHFAGVTSNLDHALHDVLQAMQKQALYVKLSAAYRLPVSVDAKDLAKLFYAAAPHQVLWGSDWPHTGGGAGGVRRSPEVIEPFRDINNHKALRHVLAATDDAQFAQTFAQKMLVDNPAHLYDF